MRLFVNIMNASRCSTADDAAPDRWLCARVRVRQMFQLAWSPYETYAYGSDELLPLTRESRDNWGGLAVTMADSLDTMLLLGLEEPYQKSRQWLLHNLPGKIMNGGDVPFFEVTIRVLGGLLGACTLRDDAALLALAGQLGRALLPALSASPSGIPYCTVHLSSGRASCPESDLGESIPLSELGSVQLEFAALAHLLDEPRFATLADGAIMAARRLPSVHGLYPSRMRPRTGGPATREVGFGAGSDSFYETLLKRWLQGGRRPERLRRMYEEALGGLRRLLRRSEPSKLLFVARADASVVGWRSQSYRSRTVNAFEHLSCFLPGLLALGAHNNAGSNATAEWEIARELLSTCTELYERQPTGLGPERLTFSTAVSVRAARVEWRRKYADDESYRDRELSPPHDYDVIDPRWPLRPEYVESLFVLWKLETVEAYRLPLRERGLRVLHAIERHCRTSDGGYAGLSSTSRPSLSNRLETFFFAETLKYLHLLFSEPSALNLETHVLTTEAHVLPVLALRRDPSGSEQEHAHDETPEGVTACVTAARVTVAVDVTGASSPPCSDLWPPWWASEAFLDEVEVAEDG